MRKLILFFAFIICGFYFSQGNSFVYEVRYKPNPAKDSIKTLKAVLDIKDTKSFFRTENQIKDDSIFATTGIRKILNFGFEEHFFVGKNSKTKEINKIIKTTLPPKEQINNLMITHAILANQQGYINVLEKFDDKFKENNDEIITFVSKMLIPLYEALVSSDMTLLFNTLKMYPQ